MPSRSTMPRVGEVVEPSGRRDQDVGSVDALGLFLHVRTAVDGLDPQLRGRRRSSRNSSHTCWASSRVGHQHERRRQRGRRRVQLVHDGQGEAQGLAGAGLRTGQGVTPGTGVLPHHGLDREGLRSCRALPVPRRPARRPRVRGTSRVPRSPDKATAGDYSSNAPSKAPTRCDTISSWARASDSLRSGSRPGRRTMPIRSRWSRSSGCSEDHSASSSSAPSVGRAVPVDLQHAHRAHADRCEPTTAPGSRRAPGTPRAVRAAPGTAGSAARSRRADRCASADRSGC